MIDQKYQVNESVDQKDISGNFGKTSEDLASSHFDLGSPSPNYERTTSIAFQDGRFREQCKGICDPTMEKISELHRKQMLKAVLQSRLSSMKGVTLADTTQSVVNE